MNRQEIIFYWIEKAEQEMASESLTFEEEDGADGFM